MVPNRGIKQVIIDCDGSKYRDKDHEEVFINACVSFLLVCKNNYHGNLYLYPECEIHTDSGPIVEVDLDSDIAYFTEIAQKIYSLDEVVFYGDLETFPDLNVKIDSHSGYFQINDKRR